LVYRGDYPVARAFKELTASGIIEKRRGVGMFGVRCRAEARHSAAKDVGRGRSARASENGQEAWRKLGRLRQIEGVYK